MGVCGRNRRGVTNVKPHRDSLMRVFMTGRRLSMGLALVFFTLLCSGAVRSQTPRHTFALGDSAFLLDGRPFAIVSGEMHFARIPREYWRDRLKMARAMGLNTVATYVFWNYHEPEKGKFRFDGNADLAAFVRTAAEEGLWVLLRPSPYACAECWKPFPTLRNGLALKGGASGEIAGRGGTCA